MPPSATLTFLFTDIEGSTRLWEEGAERMGPALARHDAILRDAIEARGGRVFATAGDAFCAVFERSGEAVAAALEAQRRISREAWHGSEPLRIRAALHAGRAEERGGDYFGPALNRAARLLSAAHGGQTLLSLTAAGLARDDLPDGAALRDLGLHRLRDLREPERIFELVHPDLPSRFPPPRTAEAAAFGLPLETTSFVGREADLAALRRALEGSRLLTLTGPGGSGKTRLARRLAAEAASDHPDGVGLADLSAVTDPAAVPEAVAAAAGVREAAGRPALEAIVAALAPRRLLLVLDECEGVTAACAEVVEAVLRACPGVKVLATSRVPLGVAGEAVRAVRGLEVPAEPAAGAGDGGRRRRAGTVAAEVGRSEAVRLFVERARLVRPDFVLTERNAAAVARICRRLDGLPLALELAAERVRALSPEEILARLDDRFRLLRTSRRAAPERHRSLRAVMDLSHDVLAAAERACLRRCSVFPGSWPLEAAEAVCAGPDLPAEDVLDALSTLVDHSLVTAEADADGSTRYRMLATVREYALERLVEAGEEAGTRDRHRDVFLELAERARPKLQEPEQAVWFDRLEREHENLAAALEWSAGGGRDPARLLRMAGALYRFWHVRGHLAEGRRWIHAALEADAGGVSPARARGLQAAGQIAAVAGEHERARALLEESLAQYRELGEPRAIAIVLNSLGIVGWEQGDVDAAEPRWTEALAIARSGPGADLQSMLLNNLGEVARRRGDLRRAEELYERAIAALGPGRDTSRTFTLVNAARVALARGDLQRARAGMAEALANARALGDRNAMIVVVEGFAEVDARDGRARRAVTLLGAGGAARQEQGLPLQEGDRPDRDRCEAAVRAALSPEAFEAAWTEGTGLTLDEAAELALEP
jgi:predicted ATPase/class 3 adenylate cyclase